MHITLQTPTPDIAKSRSFYDKLGFSLIDDDGTVKFFDGKTLIEINSDRFARIGLRVYSQDVENLVEKLRGTFNISETDKSYQLSLPGGLNIYLLKDQKAPEINTQNAITTMLGNGHGLSIETGETSIVHKALLILGFKITHGKAEDEWFVMEGASGFGVSLMKPNNCPHMFYGPSLNYFNGSENLKQIERIRNSGISISEEITIFNDKGVVDNIVLQDPGGLGFFIFSD